MILVPAEPQAKSLTRPRTPSAAPSRERTLLRDGWNQWVWEARVRLSPLARRFLDILLASIGLLIASPMAVAIAIAIRIEDRGPVLFRQTRVGRYGRTFPMLKFRSMVVNAEEHFEDLDERNHHGSDSVTFKMTDDPRITRVGRFLRRTSLDELPQLWNVLIGEMALIGPRPPTVSETLKYSLEDWDRLDVTPGLTCLWQIMGRGDLDFSEQVRLDRVYIDHRTFALDIFILFMTLPAVVSGRGAY